MSIKNYKSKFLLMGLVMSFFASMGCTGFARFNFTGSDTNAYCDSCTWYHPSGVGDAISFAGSNVTFPKVAINAQGDALVAWIQTDGVRRQIFKSEYRNGVWTHPSSLADNISPDGTDTGNTTSSLAVAMNDNGDSIIVWRQTDAGALSRLYKSEYRSGAWTHPANIGDTFSVATFNASDVNVAMDNNGTTIIAWLQEATAEPVQVFISEYRSGAWAHPADGTEFISPGVTATGTARVKMDGSGNAVITWTQDNGAGDKQVFKSEYRSGAWTHPADIEDNISPDGEDVLGTALAVGKDGSALITWTQPDGTRYQTFKSEYRSGAWVHPASLVDNISPDATVVLASSSDAAINENGDAVITWAQADGGGGQNQVFKSEYRSGAWTHPVDNNEFISVAGTHATGTQVGIDSEGRTALIWRHTGASLQVYLSEFLQGAWIHPADINDYISLGGGVTTASNVVAVSQTGYSIVAWTQSDGSHTRTFISHYR